MRTASITYIILFCIVSIAACACNEDGGDISDVVAPVLSNGGLLSCSDVSTNTITVNWGRAEDNITHQDKLRYKVVYSLMDNINTAAEAETNGTVVTNWAVNVTNARAYGLTANTIFYFNVLVMDEAGNKTAYSSISQEAFIDAVLPVVGVSNVRDGGRVESGFLTGTASDNRAVALVEVSLDGGVWHAASGTVKWRFQLPTGASSWKEGSQHTVKVRAKDASGNYSTEVSLSVTKGKNKDVNGDGYADLVVGGIGQVYIFLNSGSGFSNTAVGTADTILTGGDQFGYSIALGDLNGDGYADLAVGAEYYGLQHGCVYLFLGGASGISSKGASSADSILTGAEGSYFGHSVGLGDVNGDGFLDVVVGAYSNSPLGRVYIFLGSSSGISSRAAGGADTILTGEPSSCFGQSVAIGDVNGDGFMDVAVGAHYYNSEQGRVYLFRGGASGISTMAASNADTILTGENTGDDFGYSIALGDLNGDGYADLAGGATYYNSNQGRTYLFLGSISGISSMAAETADTILDGESLTQGYFGRSLAFGDINGDGYMDVAVGANVCSPQGRAYLFLSSSSGISSKDAGSADAILTGETSSINSYFGISVMMGDLNNDGYADLAVGAHFYNYYEWQGRMYLFSGSNTGISSMEAGSANTIIDGEAGSRFGWSMGF